MLIYLAASFPKRAYVKDIADALKEDGHEITARWVYTTHKAYAGVDKDHDHDKQFAAEDLCDVERAQCVVVISDGPQQLSRGGRHTELGVALTRRKPVILFGPKEQVFHALCEQIESMDLSDLRKRLKEIETDIKIKR